MFEVLNPESLMTAAIVGASAMALVGGVMMIRSPRPAAQPADIDRAVKNAPYHRLHNVLPLQQK